MLVGSNCWCDCPGFSFRSINWRGIWEEYNGVNRALNDSMRYYCVHTTLMRLPGYATSATFYGTRSRELAPLSGDGLVCDRITGIEVPIVEVGSPSYSGYQSGVACHIRPVVRVQAPPKVTTFFCSSSISASAENGCAPDLGRTFRRKPNFVLHQIQPLPVLHELPDRWKNQSCESPRVLTSG